MADNAFLQGYRSSSSYGTPGTFTDPNAVKPPKLNWIEKNLNSIGGGGGAVAGGLAGAGIGSVIPGAGTVVGGLLGALIGGATGGFAGETAKQNLELHGGTAQAADEVRKQALIQGGLGLAGEGAGGLIAKIAGKGVAAGATTAAENPGILGKIGGSLRQDVMNPIVKPSPFGAAAESAITKNANDLLPRGSAAAKYSAMPRTMDALGNQLETVLAKNTATVPAHDITTTLTSTLGDATKFPTTDPAFVKAVDQHLSNILQAGAQNGGELTAADIANIRRGLQDIAFKPGAVVTPQKEAAQAVWAHLGDTLQQVAPEAKSIIADQGVLFKAAPGLAKAADKTMGVPLLGVKSKGAARVVQATADNLGAGLNRAGEVVGGARSLIGKLATTPVGKAVEQAAVRKPQLDAQSADVTPPTDVAAPPADSAPADTTPADSGGFTPEALQAMAINDIHATGGKNLDKIATLSSLFGPNGKATNATPKLSTAAQARSDALTTALAALDGASGNLTASGGAQGPKGNLATIPVVGSLLDPQGAAYHNTKIELATQLAKAITGGSRPAQQVIEKYLHSLPDVNDTPAYADAKVKKLKTELLTQAKAFGLTGILQNNQ